jgi:para-aminobenzoate synthetase/4-amino-4-deoxychorismate lyase
MLVVEGRPIELDAHLARLAASVDGLYGSRAPASARRALLDRARGIRLGRMRLTIAPEGDGRLGFELAAGEIEPATVFPTRERGAALRSIVIEGGLGPHKWADRSTLERAKALPTEAVPLLLDGDGSVLEASRANVFVVHQGTLTTPSADGRILPGIARARTIEIAEAIGIELGERAVELSDLLDAEEVFLTGSVRGIEPVRSVDGTEREHQGDVTSRLTAELRHGWLGASA